MVDRLVLVNGLPGSGKTTVAVALASALPATVLSKDLVKEALADALPAVPCGALGPAAMEAAWALTAALPGTVVLDSWWFKPRDLQLAQAAIGRCRPRAVVEVWCEVPAELARRRYEQRRRHPVHDEARHLAESWDRWAAEAEPLGISATVRVSTKDPVDIDALALAVTRSSDP